MYNLLLHKQKPRNRIESDESNETEAHVAPLSIPICKPLPIVPCMRMSMCVYMCVYVSVCVCARSVWSDHCVVGAGKFSAPARAEPKITIACEGVATER